jgi:hypothetical protein
MLKTKHIFKYDRNIILVHGITMSGVTVSKHYKSWKTHIDTAVPKISSACFAIRPI